MADSVPSKRGPIAAAGAVSRGKGRHATQGIVMKMIPFGLTVGIGAALWAGRSVNWAQWAVNFFTGPGSISRILLVIFTVTNWKSVPLGWTVRVLSSVFRFLVFNRRPLPPRAIFHYSITQTYNSLLETDYNLHKSNSTYFADLDVSRGHLVMTVLQPGLHAVNNNARTKVVRDKEGNIIRGDLGVILGSVFCNFRKPIAPFAKFEIWSRVLCWDRKWLYILSYFVVKGKVRPTSWDGPNAGKVRAKGPEGKDFEKYVYAVAISKYVFKLGRFTINPALLLEKSDLLPERPGEGWMGGPEEVGTPDDLGEITEDSPWDWKKVEWERRKGVKLAEEFAALDAAGTMFDGGEDGALQWASLG